MLGKNNHQARLEKSGEKVYRYAIKRLTIGVASVAVMAGIQFSGLTTVAMAHEVDSLVTNDLEDLGTGDPSVNSEAVASVEEPAVDKLVSSETSSALPSESEGLAQPEPEVSVDKEVSSDLGGVNSEDQIHQPANEERHSTNVVTESQPASHNDRLTAPREHVTADELSVNQPVAPRVEAEHEVNVHSESKPHEATNVQTNPEPEFDAFASRVLTANEPKEVLRHELAKVYEPSDVEGILNFISLNDVNSPEKLREEIVKAGLAYAESRNGRARVLAVLPRNALATAGGQNVNDQVRVNNIQYINSQSNKGYTTINENTGGYLSVAASMTVPGSVKAGDYFTVDYGQYIRPGALNVPVTAVDLTSGNNVVAKAIYDAERNIVVYQFTDWVNDKSNITASINQGTQPLYDKVTDSFKNYPITVSIANQKHTENVQYDFNSVNRDGSAKKLVDGTQTKTDRTDPNKYYVDQTWYINRDGKRAPDGPHSILIETDFSSQGKTPQHLESIKVYEVLNDAAFTDSFNPNFNSNYVREVSARPYQDRDGNTRVNVGSGPTNGKKYIVQTVTSAPNTGGAGRTNSKVSLSLRNKFDSSTDYKDLVFVQTFSNSIATGENTPGMFVEKHRYETVDTNGRLISVDDQITEAPQSGTKYENYSTAKEDRSGYQFVRVENPKNNPSYSLNGSPASGAFKPGVTQEVTYVYQRVQKPKTQDLYEMTVEDSSFKTQFRQNNRLQPGQIQKVQEGRDERVRVLYRHVDPDTVPNFTPSNFVQMRGQYWEEVSREVIQEAQDEIFEYNFETITETRTNPDGSVTIVYNTGREVHIPAAKPAEPAQPLQPKEPIVETERVTDAHPDTGEQVRGTRVTIRIFNPNTDKFEKEEVRFIPDGLQGPEGDKGKDGKDGLTPQAIVKDNGNGTHTVTVRTPQRDPLTGEVTYTETTTTIKDGDDGKSPKAEVKDNGDGTHTITITNPDGTKTETVVRNGEKGEKGDKGENGTDGKDGKDGLTPQVTVKDNSDGTHTVTVRTPQRDSQTGEVTYTETTTTIKDGEDGKSPKAEVKDNGDGTHTITITNPDGTKTETVVRNGEKGEKGDKGENGTDGKDGKDGLTPQVTVKDNGDGTHTVTVRTPQRDPQTGEVTYTETTTTIKDGEDGKSPKAEVKDNGDGTHTITITNPDGTKTETVVRNGEKGEKGYKGENGTDGKDGKDGLTPQVTVKDNGDGTHTVTVRTPQRDPQTGEVTYSET
ncbi:collagen-flanked surface repeat-containing protein, partial [Hutsoniella sourekii]